MFKWCYIRLIWQSFLIVLLHIDYILLLLERQKRMNLLVLVYVSLCFNLDTVVPIYTLILILCLLLTLDGNIAPDAIHNTLQLLPTVSMLEVISKPPSSTVSLRLKTSNFHGSSGSFYFDSPTTPPPSPIPYLNRSSQLYHQAALQRQSS